MFTIGFYRCTDLFNEQHGMMTQSLEVELMMIPVPFP
jgi:hypothetical protein